MALRKIIKQDEFRELGFGNRVVREGQRLMNKDGSSNVSRRGLPFFKSLNVYHALITMKWWKFNIIVLSFYIVVNLIFASLYYFIAPEQIGGMEYHSEIEKFMEIFFFSAQSLTTVGYGRLNPTGILDSTIATAEAMTGLLGFALATGLLYGRFSRPVAKVIWSKNVLIAPYKDISGLMLRVANRNISELVDIQASVMLSYVNKEAGKPVRKFASLKLELTKVSLLSMSWTIVHPIDAESPISGWTREDFMEKDAEILVLMNAYEETFSQTVHTRTSYRPGEVVAGARFLPMVEAGANGETIVRLDRINDYENAAIEQAVAVSA